MEPADARPLSHLRVVDLATGSLAAIGRTLAELGADVIRIEPPGGGADRRENPLAFAIANTSKRAVALDLATPDGRAQAQALIGTADILVECGRHAVDAAALHRRHPGLVILSAAPFGADGDYAHWQATDPVLHALSGSLSRSGNPGRPPLPPPSELAMACAAVQAVFVILLACVNRLTCGLGDHLDFSLLDACSQALDPGYGIAGSASAGVPPSALPRNRVEARHLYPIIACRDGHVRICVLSPRQWRGMFAWLGRPAAFADGRFNDLQARFASPELVPAIAALFAGQTRAELEAAGQRHGVPTAGLMGLEEALASEHLQARGALRKMQIAPGVVASVPDGVMEVGGRRMGVRGAAPGIGEHAGGLDMMLARRVAAPVAACPGRRPLEGLRVLDFGVIVVGAEQGRLLADQGADVIKVESSAFPDGARQGRGDGPIAPTFAAGHFNKRSLGIDLRDPRGRTLLLRLAAQSDVILSNFKPGTLESLGLGDATLRALNPRLILVDSSAFGSGGPWSSRLGYGPLVRAATGLTALWRHPDEPDGFADATTVYPDHVAARVGAIGVLALLLRRELTGDGGTVSVAQNEVMLGQLAQLVAAATMDPPVVPPARDAPWGVFACAGDDEWCVVTVRDDGDFRQLCAVIGRGDLAADRSLANGAGRAAARARIDGAVGEWLARHSPVDAMTRLQKAGVPAGAMLRVSELPGFGYFAQRGAYRLVRHPHLPEPFHREAMPVRSHHLPVPADGPAPLLGEHTAAIVRERLGLSDAEMDDLLAAGVLEAWQGAEKDRTPQEVAG